MVGKIILGLDEAEEQNDRPGGRESIGCDTDAGIQADGGGGTGEGGKKSTVSVPPSAMRSFHTISRRRGGGPITDFLLGRRKEKVLQMLTGSPRRG